jgi:hypothetical protein
MLSSSLGRALDVEAEECDRDREDSVAERSVSSRAAAAAVVAIVESPDAAGSVLI